MPNDDNTLAAMLALAVGGAAGYAAGRWVVEPWLETRNPSRPTMTPRSAITGVPFDPYAEPPLAPPPTIVTIIPPQGSGEAVSSTGPITSPSQVGGPITSPTPIPSGSQSTSGPITSPSQVDGSPTSPIATSPSVPAAPSLPVRSATSARVRRYDAVFNRYRGSIPLSYVRALVDRESNGRADVRTGSAVGLMQIVPVVLVDYNKRHGTSYQATHLVDPSTNVAIGCELLRLIANNYRKHHPRIPNLQPDWNNPRFVELLTFGWNAGFSEAGGVGRVARYLEKLGAVDVTLDQVTAHARLAGASKHLSNPAKVAWCKSVVALYQRDRALVEAPAVLVA